MAMCCMTWYERSDKACYFSLRSCYSLLADRAAAVGEQAMPRIWSCIGCGAPCASHSAARRAELSELPCSAWHIHWLLNCMSQISFTEFTAAKRNSNMTTFHSPFFNIFTQCMVVAQSTQQTNKTMLIFRSNP